MGFWIRCHFPISMFLRLGKAGWYCIIKGNNFFCVLSSLFFKRPFSAGADNSSHAFLQTSSGILFPFFNRIFKLWTFFCQMWNVAFVFRMRIASPFANPFSTPRKKCLRAGATPARRWVNMNEFLRGCPYVNKNRGVVDKAPLRCYIKYIPQILKVLSRKPYKRLWKIIKLDFSGSFYTETTVLTLLISL